MEAIYFWMTREGITPQSTSLPRFINTGEVADGTNAKTQYYSNFGFMVRRTGDDWSDADIYIPQYTTSGSYWIKATEFGENFFIYVPSAALPMVRISNTELVSPSSNVLRLNFDIEFLNEYLGVEDYQKVFEDTYNIYTMINDEFGFIP